MSEKYDFLNPMSESEADNIEVKDEVIAEKFKFDPGLRGKWMLLYDKDYMDDMWRQAVALYRAGELPGVVSIKTSTAVECPRAAQTEMGVIRFVCGPCDDENLVLDYGLNLVDKMRYFNSYAFVAYKIDDRSRLGTKATGAIRNYEYRLPVSTYDHLKIRSGISSEYPIDVPSQTWDRWWVQESLHSTVVEQAPEAVEYSKMVMWMMTFAMGDPHDSAWVNACRLYRSGELGGVLFLSSSTAKDLAAYKGRKDGFIYFYCHPNDFLMDIGANLVRRLNYSSRFGRLRCTSQEVGREGFKEVCRVPL